MWIGTERGLNRFNGYDFHQFFSSSDTTGLPGNNISDLALDNHGRLWVGTEDGVAIYSDDGGFIRVPVNSKEKSVYQILCSREGQIILNMMEDLCVYDDESGCFESRISTIDRYRSYCQRCYLDDNGKLWSVASLEIRCFDSSTLVNTNNYSTLHFVATSALLSCGEIWMAGRRSLSIFNTETRQYEELPEAITSCPALIQQEVEFIAEADSSNVFIKLADGSLFRYNREQNTVNHVSLAQMQAPSDFALKGIFIDREGRLWLSSDNSGFVVSPPISEDSRYSLSTGEMESAAIVSSSRDSDGNIWLFSLHDGLFHFETDSGKLSRVDVRNSSPDTEAAYLHSNNPIVFADSSGCIWMSNPDSRSIMKGSYKAGKMKMLDQFSLYYPRVGLCDSDGGVWIGTFNYYVHYMSPDGGEMQHIQLYPAKTTQITCMVEYGDYIIVGAYNEPLMMIDRHTLTMELLPVPQENYENCCSRGFFYPTVLRQDSNGDILIGTRYNGLLRYRSGTLQKIAGFPETDIASLEEDSGGRLWVSTTDGIIVFNPSEDSWYDYYSPGIRNGMYFYDRSSLCLDGRYFIFGTSQGLVVINPDAKPSSSNATLFFEDIKLENRGFALAGCKSLYLSHHDRSFGITFAVPDYLGVGAIRYKYYLEKVNHGWVELGSGREIYFSDLRPGKYKLRVSHYSGENILSENVLEIRIAPHPLLSLPAILFYAAIIALLVILAWRARRKLLEETIAAKTAEYEKEQEKNINRLNMTFFSNVSHEFRTPLTMISGPVSQLKEESGLSAQGKYLLSLVKTSVDRMLSLVNQLMDFSKMENASLDLMVSRGDIVPFLSDIMAVFKANAESLGITFIEEGLEYPLITWFDPDKVQKILSNLMSNALKFTPRGGTIVLELDEYAYGEDQSIRITVSDTGEGIPEDKLELIFDRYYQLENSRKNAISNGGTGIGLYYARNLALIHHGTLTASNREGGGAVFTLVLPKSESAYSKEERTVAESSVTGRFPLETMPAMTAAPFPLDDEDSQLPLILAVDDDPDIIHYLVSLFSSQYRIRTANSADEAYKIALETFPDVILSDVAMPGKDGFEFCREIKQDLQLCHIPVILVTAMGTMENQVLGLNEGADAYVTKPFDVSYLRALVRSQLDNRRRVQKLVNAATGSSSLGSLNSRDKSFLGQLYEVMEQEISNEDLDIARLASLLKISRTKFYYKMKGLTGKSPSEFFIQYKLNVAAKMLAEGKLNVSEVAIKTGFSSLAHFSKSFKKQFGVSPSKYSG